MRVVGYVRASRWGDRRVDEHLDEQRSRLARAARARGWDLAEIVEDRVTGRTLRRRGLQSALDVCRRGEADALTVTDLSRLTREPDDLATVAADALGHGFTVLALAEDVDLAGRDRPLAQALATMAGWRRRRMVRERARSVTAPRRRGRPPSTPADVARRIRDLRNSGATLQAICDTLNAEGVPTPRGGTHWRPTSLRAVLRTDPKEDANAV